jgi:hypothetical protein
MLMLGRRRDRQNRAPMPLLKKLFWLYFLLLLFEGALRKWIFPDYSAALLLIRDPVAVWIIWEAFRTQKWPRNWSAVSGILCLMLVCLCVVQTVFGNNPWFVALFGLRTYLLPFPVAFIMGENLDGEDLRRFAIFTLWILLPMTALEVAQYLAPANAWINVGAYSGAKQIIYVGDHVRASGTFSYDIGPIDLVPLAAAFVLYGLVNEKFAKKWLLWSGAFAIVLSVPIVGARTLVYELAGVVASVAMAALFGVSQFAKSLKIIFPLLFVLALASFLPVFSDSTATLTTRFSQASKSEGNTEQVLVVRLLDPLTGHIEDVDFSENWFGIGLGRGASAVAALTGELGQFKAGEEASSRAINEMGPFPGVAFILFCYSLGFLILGKAILRARDQEPLALLLVPAMLAALCMGVFEQPTEQGFMVITVAFSLAALKLNGLPVRQVSLQNEKWLGRLDEIRARRASQPNLARRPVARG